MGLLQRVLGSAVDFNKNLRNQELQYIPPQFQGGGHYTDPHTKQGYETPVFGDGTNAVGGLAWLIAAPFVLLGRIMSGPRHVTAAPVPPPVPYTPGVATPLTGAVLGRSYEQPFGNDNPEPFVVINGQSVPREFADMYDHGLDEVCFHGESQKQSEPH